MFETQKWFAAHPAWHDGIAVSDTSAPREIDRATQFSEKLAMGAIVNYARVTLRPPNLFWHMRPPAGNVSDKAPTTLVSLYYTVD